MNHNLLYCLVIQQMKLWLMFSREDLFLFICSSVGKSLLFSPVLFSLHHHCFNIRTLTSTAPSPLIFVATFLTGQCLVAILSFSLSNLSSCNQTSPHDHHDQINVSTNHVQALLHQQQQCGNAPLLIWTYA